MGLVRQIVFLRNGAFVLSIVAIACGGKTYGPPAPEAECDPVLNTLGAACQNSTTVLHCESAGSVSRWNAYNCRGPNGCTGNGSCDSSTVVEGEACNSRLLPPINICPDARDFKCIGSLWTNVGKSCGEGEACTATSQCAAGMTCFAEPPGGTSGGKCRKTCTPSGPACQTNFNCFDTGGSAGAACVPAPSSTSMWKVRLTSGVVPGTNGGSSWDSAGQPDPVLCLGTSNHTICSNEIGGTFAPQWNYLSTATIPHSELAAGGILFFDSDASSTFSACEQTGTGDCGLSSWSRDSIGFSGPGANGTFDLRPLWAGQSQPWTITGGGASVSIQFEPQ